MTKFAKTSLGLWTIQTLWAAAMVIPSSLHAETILSLSGNAPLVTTSLNYDGGGAIVNGNGYSGYFVQSGALSLSNVTLTNFVTTGGSGSGGGAALGGAVFVNNGATVTLTNVSFGDNGVVGGEGGVGTTGGSLNNRFNTGSTASSGVNGESAAAGSAYVNGANGWNGYNGSAGSNATAGIGGTGGAGGNGSDGSATTADTVKAALDVTYDGLTSAEDGTVSGVYTSISATFGAQAAAAAAGVNAGGPTTANLAAGFTTLATQFGTLAAETAGAKMTKDAAKAAFDAAYLVAISVTNLEVGVGGNGGNGGAGGNGGNGSFGYGGGQGGAGGNGGDAYSASNAIGGEGGDGGTGGNGSFGAGGGSGGNGGSAGSDGDNATNEGADGAGGSGGTGGFGAGNGSTADGSSTGSGGNGGSGYGGSLFVASGGTLNINGSATFSQGHALGGGSENGGDSGEGVGTDLFIMKGSTVNLNAGNGVITFNGTIADDSKSSIGASSIADGKGASINVNSGLVIFNGANTYSGQTNITGGVLQAWDGVGLYTNSNLNLAGGVFQSSGIFDRYVGTAAWKVQWTGNGGFAAVDGGLTVRLNGGTTLTWDTNSFVPTGSSLIFGSTSATDSVTFVNNINLNGGNRKILVAANADNSDTAILTGVLSNGALTVNDASHSGILILTNVSTYSGGTTINNGTLALSGSAKLNADGAVATNGTFDISKAHDQTIGDLSGSGLVNLGSNRLTLNIGDSLFSGSITDGGLGGGTGGSITKRGSGTLTLTGSNSYTGGTIIDAGGRIAMKNNGTLYRDGAVQVNGTFDISQGISQTIGDLSGSGLVQLGSNRLTLNIGDSLFSGSITDGGIGGGTGGSITKRGSGTLTLTGSNSYTGGTIIDAGGRIAMKNNGTLYRDGAVKANGTFDISQGISQTIGDLSGAGQVNLGGNRLTLNIGNSLFSGSITDGGLGGGTGGSITKRGSGTLTLTGSNSYTGGTIIDAGGRIAMKDNGILYRDGAVQVNGAFDISQGISQTIGDLSGSGLVQLGANRLTLNIGDSLFSGNITDGGLGGGTGGSITKRGSGTLTLTGSNSYTGGTIIDAGGRIAMKNNGILYRDGAVDVNGTFDISQGISQTIGDLSGSGLVNLGSNRLTLNIGDSLFSGNITDGGIGGGTGGSITKRGSGTLTLTGSNSYTGGTIIDAGGRIAMKDNGILYRDGAVEANGIFDISQGISQTIGDLSGSGLVQLGANRLTLNIGDSLFSGSITDGGIGGGTGGSITKRGSGTLTLTGVSIYTGGTIIDAGGRIAMKDNGILYRDGAVEVNGTFDISQGISQTIGDLSGSGLVNLGSNRLTLNIGDSLFSGNITDGGLGGGTGGSITKRGSGTLTLTGTGSYTGGTIIDAGGTLALKNSAKLYSEGTIQANGTFDISQGTSQTIGDLSGSGLVRLGDNRLTLNIGDSLFSGSIIDGGIGGGTGGSITKRGSGTLTLTGSNSYTGGTIIDAGGRIAMKNNGTLYRDGAVKANGVFDISQGVSQIIGDLSGSGLVNLGSNRLTLNIGDSLFSGSITDGGLGGGTGGSITKRGSGTLTLTGSNSYTGGTIIDAGGTLALAGNGSLYSGGALTVNGTFDVTAKNSDLIAGDLIGSGLINLGSKKLTFGTANNTAFSGVISGNANASLIKEGTGTFAFSGTSSVNSWAINTGAVALEASTSGSRANLSNQASVTVARNAALIINNANTIQTLTTHGLIGGSAMLTADQYHLNDEAVVNTKLGAGTVYANGAVTINAAVAADNVFIQSGIVTLGAADVLSHNATVDITLNAQMILKGGDQTILNLTGAGNVYEENNYVLHVTNGGNYSGKLVSVGSLVKSGSGSLTLSGENTYNAGTTVQEGELIVNGLLNSNVGVSAGGTLKGSGTLSGNLINNGILAPGNSPGVFTINGNYTENAILQIEVGGYGGAGVNPNGHDQVLVSGITQLNPSTSSLQIKQYNGFVASRGDTFKIINARDGSIKGAFGNITSELNQKVLFSRWNGSLVYTGLTASQNLTDAFSNITANQKAMLRGLRVGQDQYDGGNLVSQLLQASNPSIVFDKASPEAYAGTVDYALRSLRAYTTNALNMESVLEQGKFTLFGGYSGFSTGANSSVDLANYDLDSNGGIVGVRGQVTKRFSTGFFGGVDNGTVNSTFLRSDVTGSVWGLFSEYALTADRRLLAVGTLSTAFFSTDGTRNTNTSTSRFESIDSSSQEASLSLQYVWLKGCNYIVKPELKLTYSTASTDGFTEKNRDISEALRVNGIDGNSFMPELAINGEWNVLSKLTLKGRVAVYHDVEDASRDVTAHLARESSNFTVQAPGMGQTEVNFTVGSSYRFNERVGFGLSYKGGYNPDANFSNTYSANLSVSF